MGNFLDSLGIGGAGIDTYITLSVSSGLEMVTVDSSGNINTYVQIPSEYNESKREIPDYDNFKDEIKKLFELSNVNPVKAGVHLSLPSVWLGIKDQIPLLLDDEAITNIVTGELEQTFVFKSKDPESRWFDAVTSQESDSRTVVYTAIQKDVLEKIKGIFQELGASLVSVENEVISDIRGIYSTGAATAVMNDNSNWSLMVINNSGYQLFSMVGKRIQSFFEEPLPLKSFEGEEVYDAIEGSVQIALLDSTSTNMVIVSQSDYVSAEILSTRLQFGGNISFVEDNKFRREPLMEYSLNVLQEDKIKISLHMVGAISPSDILPYEVNFVKVAGGKSSGAAVIPIQLGGGKIFNLTPQIASIISACVALFIIVVTGIFFLVTNTLAGSLTSKIEEVDSQLESVKSEIAQYQKSSGDVKFDVVQAIERVLKNNRLKIMSYSSLGESIPQNLYLTYYMTSDEGLIDIKGCATSVEDVYVFFKNLKDFLVGSNLRLSKLNLKTGSLDSLVNGNESNIDNAPYVFEITNMNDGQLSSLMGNLNAGAAPSEQNGNGEKSPQ